MVALIKDIDINAHIANITCEIDCNGEVSKALISFDNLGFGTVTAVKFNAKGFNTFGDVVQISGNDEFFLIVQDIRVEKNTSIKNLKAILPSKDIRKLELKECQICYDDNSVTSYSGVDNRRFQIEEFQTSGTEAELLDAIKDVITPKAKCVPQDYDIGWLCSCERFNTSNSSVCSNCGVEKAEIFKITDANYISEILEKHRRNEEIRRENAEKESAEREEVKKKQRIKLVISMILGTLLIAFFWYSNTMSHRTTFPTETYMKTAMTGTYTHYDGSIAEHQLHINGSSVTLRYCALGSNTDINFSIKSWNYKKGTIDLSESSDNIIITDSGDLIFDGNTYNKGGSWSAKATGYFYSSDPYGSSYSSDYESGATALKVTPTSLTSNSYYTTCKGSVKNNGTRTYKYVEVKGAFKDSNGNVIDTDWTYAVGSEGLAPGESSTFEVSVPYNSDIDSCTVSLLDYN